jgi:di/tricarboxylate transporter
MTLHQSEAFLIVASMLGLFAWGRLRHDIVALLALAAGLVTGVVPAGKAFFGFANPVVIIIASVLVLSRAIAISGVIELAMRGSLRRLHSTSAQIGALTGCVAILSAFMKNVGALGIFMPIAIQTAERAERSPSAYLMPLAFGLLIGGTITQIGTSPNLLISVVRQDFEGHPFALFDFAPVGLPLTALAVVFLALGWRLIPKDRTAERAVAKRFEIEDYLSEAKIPSASPFAGKTVQDVEEVGDGGVAITAIIRESNRRYIPGGDWKLFGNDILVLQADPAALKPFLDQGQLELVGAAGASLLQAKEEELETVEAVVMADSPMVGQTSFDLHLRRRFQTNLLSISRGVQRLTTRLARTRFQVGDVVLLQGRAKTLPEAMAQLGCLPLAERYLTSYLTMSRKRPRLLPLVILVAAMVLVALKLLPVEVAFFIAAVLVVLLRLLTPKEAYDAVDWPIVVMLGALIPVGESLQATGAAGLIGNGLTIIAAHLPGGLAVALVLLTSMLITPFLHHAPAVVVMGPIAAILARNLGFMPDAFLMAVALGASCDFLTPIGHQNNMLVMGPGGYRFGDYWRLGLPLSCIVVAIGTPLILFAWPLQ